jgi:hypothetical protein
MNSHFPIDNRLRDDIGLPPLAEFRPPLSLMPPPAPKYFPTDDRLRDDIGLPPLAQSVYAAAPPGRSLAQRAARLGAAAVRTAACVMALAASLRSLGYTRGLRQPTARHF